MKLKATYMTWLNFLARLSGVRSDDSGFAQRLAEHFGQDVSRLPVIAEKFRSYDIPNVYLAIQEYVNGDGRAADVLGVVYEEHQAPGLSELAVPPETAANRRVREGPIQYLSIEGASDSQLAFVQRALYLVREGKQRLAIFFRTEDDILEDLHIEVMAYDKSEAESFLTDLRGRMRSRNVYRGKAISIAGGPWGNIALQIHQLPQISRDGVILPNDLLERIERHTINFSQHASALSKTGHHLKRGFLLHGRPGTGKTLTAMYLAAQMHGRTTLLLTGEGLNSIESCCKMARMLEPSIVILEDVDLVAEERTKRGISTPLLFTLLNQMDGLGADADILFLLTTNRPEILEPALASRPGRIDQAFEIPLPDEDCRRRLFAFYAQGIPMQIQSLDHFIKQTRGVSAAFIREVMRRATVLSLDEGQELVISSQHLQRALSDLLDGGSLTKRLLGFYPRNNLES